MIRFRRYRDLSIQSKLRLIVSGACGAVLIVTCAAFVVFKWYHQREQAVSVMSVRVQILAANMAAPLAFQTPEDAMEVLNALAVDRDIEVAAVFNRSGELFAAYPERAPALTLAARKVTGLEHRFEGGRLVVWAPILQGEQRLGTFTLRNSLEGARQAVRRVAWVTAGLLVMALGLSYGLAAWLQRAFTRPLLELTQTAREVARRHDFSLRARRLSEDEIGVLADDFNTMLGQIQHREAALVESETRKGAILASALDAIITINHEGRVQEFNPAAEKLFGYTAGEAVGRKLDELIVPATHREAHCRGMARFLATGQSRVLGRRIEMPALRADGAILEVELAITRISNSEPPVFTGFIRDITERRRAERAMHESEERFRTLTVATTQIVWTTNAVGEVSGPLPSWQAFTGQTEEEVRGIGWARAVHPDDVRATTAVWQRAVQERGNYDTEYRVRRHDGVYRHFSARGVPVKNPDGSIREWVGTCTDITERKKAELELREAAERLTALNRLDRIISSNLDLAKVFAAFARELSALVPCDQALFVSVDGDTEQWKVEREWNRAKPKAPGLNCGALTDTGIGWVAEQKRPLVEALISSSWAEASLLREAGFQSRALFPLVLGHRTVAVFCVAGTTSGAFDRVAVDFMQALADQLTVAVQNIRLFAEVRQHAADLERRVEERTVALVTANKELEAFSYSVSHDLRAPLRAVAGFARILVDEHGEELPEDMQRYLKLIQDSAQRMGQLIDDLLAFSRLSRQAMNRVPFDLGRLCRDVLKTLAPEMAGRALDVRVGELPMVEGDPILLRQVMVNLLSNALKYSRPRAPAVIEVGALPEEESGAGPVIYVRDNGVGFDMKHAGKLFGVFQRLHRTDEFEGTGVGLAIVERIIHRHGGRIWTHARPEGGATFFFTLGGSPGASHHDQQNQ